MNKADRLRYGYRAERGLCRIRVHVRADYASDDIITPTGLELRNNIILLYK